MNVSLVHELYKCLFVALRDDFDDIPPLSP
jgi:hypothetical protein